MFEEESKLNSLTKSQKERDENNFLSRVESKFQENIDLAN